MDRNRNWLGIIAIALAGLALVVAIGGRSGPAWGHRMAYYAQAPQVPHAPQAPQVPFGGRFERGQGFVHPHVDAQIEVELRDGHGFGPGFHGRGGHGHGFGPLGLIFGLFNALTKIAALGMLAWLLLRLFQQRNAPPAGPAPTTPAGHDPRVE